MAEIMDVMLKLFDTLKDQMKEVQSISQALLTNQNDIGNYMRNLPMDEVKQLLKDHSKESTDEIGTCTETVETQTDVILKEVEDLKGKVKTMIIVVVVAFTLFTSAVMIAKLTEDETDAHDSIMQRIEQLEKKK